MTETHIFQRFSQSLEKLIFTPLLKIAFSRNWFWKVVANNFHNIISESALLAEIVKWIAEIRIRMKRWNELFREADVM
jgi:hypothetical protein